MDNVFKKKFTEEQVKKLKNEGLVIELEKEEKDDDTDEIEEEEDEEKEEFLGETSETETIEIPFPKLDEEFTGKVSFVDRCKLMEVIEENYIYKRVIRPSSESEPRAVGIEHAVLFHMNAFIEEQYEVPFDSTYIRKRPILSRLSRVLKGYAIALLMMKVGEVAEFAIHHAFAYGKLGCPPRIPERSNLIVIIEVLDVYERGTVEYFHSVSIYEQDEKVTSEEVIGYAKGDLKMGNELFRKGDYEKAIIHFRRASNLLERAVSGTSVEDDYNQLLLVLYKNAAVCAIQLKNGPTTVNLSRRALRLDGSSAKAYFLLAQGYILLEKLERAKLYLSKAHSSRPGDTDIKEALEKLDQLIAENETGESFEKAIVPFEKPTREASSAANEPTEEGHRISIFNMIDTMKLSEPMWDIAEDE